MRILVVQNYRDTGLGQLGTALEEAQATVDLRPAHLGAPVPVDASAHDALVVLGGGQHALDDRSSPYFPQLLALIRSFVACEKSVLGICLGSQLLARAFGGTNQIGGATEFGWHCVRLAAEAKADPVFRALPEAFPIFEWHDDTFTLPDGAALLASSDRVANQAFRIGRAAYGTQFHFEADRTMVAAWTATFAELLAARHPDWTSRHAAEAKLHGPEADRVGLEIARAWLTTVAAPTRRGTGRVRDAVA